MDKYDMSLHMAGITETVLDTAQATAKYEEFELMVLAILEECPEAMVVFHMDAENAAATQRYLARQKDVSLLEHVRFVVPAKAKRTMEHGGGSFRTGKGERKRGKRNPREYWGNK